MKKVRSRPDVPSAAIDELAGVFKALSNPHRLRIWCYLLDRPDETHVSAIEQALGIKQSHLSQSLGILSANGLVVRERDGSRVHYRADETRLAETELLRALLSKRSRN